MIRTTALFAAALLGCGSAPQADPAPAPARPQDVAGVPIGTAPAPWSDAWLDGEATRYLDDAAFRREILESSLTNPSNIYSSTRLSSYGFETRGWDALPEWTPRASPIGTEAATALERGAPVAVDAAAERLWDGTRPGTFDAWVELGRRVFHLYPLRPEVFAEHALRNPDIADAVGLHAASDGSRPGVVAFEDIDGEAKIGITCALCHVSLEDGVSVEGRARRNLDYGQMRLAFHRDTGDPLPRELAERMASWGRGRADITQDDDEDPVAIVDLWGVRKHAYLTQAGTLKHVHPAALAIRQETQILHANRERTRPPRELAWALAMYVYSLSPPARHDATADATAQRGAKLFDRHCQHCHGDDNHAGDPVAAATVGTDPTLAFGQARGTGLYRPSPLVRVADAAPYLHHGAVSSLDALFDPQRPEPGHRYGTSLPQTDRDALVAYLVTL